MVTGRAILTCAAVTLLSLTGCAPETAREALEDEVNEPAGRDALAQPVIDLTTDQLAQRIESGTIRLIDVRTDEEVVEGIIPGAEHITLDTFDPASLDLSDGREVVLYCRSGRRSAVAAERLSDHTGRPAAHLAGGILGWEAADGPIDQPITQATTRP